MEIRTSRLKVYYFCWVRVNVFDKIDSACLQFTNLTITLLHILTTLHFIVCNKPPLSHFTYVNINIFARFNNCFFKLIVVYSDGDAGKLKVITTMCTAHSSISEFPNFWTFFSRLLHTVFWMAKSLCNHSFIWWVQRLFIASPTTTIF